MDAQYRRESSAGYLVNWAARLFTRALERRLPPGSSAGTMPVFFALIDGKAQTQKELAHWAAVEQPTMANTLARMERDGLIVREPDPDDRRSALIRLTRFGLERARIALKTATETNALGLTPLSPVEQEAFLEMLRRVVQYLDADAGPDETQR
jgi:DNA-binding MarR family transcriptional regulator